MFTRCLSVITIALLASPVLAAEPTTGPVIDGYGAAFTVEDRDVPLVKDHIYRVVYEITAYDAAYVALSERLSLPLVTADERLVQHLAGTGLDVRFLGDWP